MGRPARSANASGVIGQSGEKMRPFEEYQKERQALYEKQVREAEVLKNLIDKTLDMKTEYKNESDLNTLIGKAYRKLSIQYHPDHSNDLHAAEKFSFLKSLTDSWIKINNHEANDEDKKLFFDTLQRCEHSTRGQISQLMPFEKLLPAVLPLFDQVYFSNISREEAVGNLALAEAKNNSVIIRPSSEPEHVAVSIKTALGIEHYKFKYNPLDGNFYKPNGNSIQGTLHDHVVRKANQWVKEETLKIFRSLNVDRERYVTPEKTMQAQEELMKKNQGDFIIRSTGMGPQFLAVDWRVSNDCQQKSTISYYEVKNDRKIYSPFTKEPIKSISSDIQQELHRRQNLVSEFNELSRKIGNILDSDKKKKHDAKHEAYENLRVIWFGKEGNGYKSECEQKIKNQSMSTNYFDEIRDKLQSQVNCIRDEARKKTVFGKSNTEKVIKENPIKTPGMR